MAAQIVLRPEAVHPHPHVDDVPSAVTTGIYALVVMSA